jgi:uncharacterized protein YjbI with pentapeptide repeats
VETWRKEREISSSRQALLLDRLTTVPDALKGRYPFSALKLTRADLEWLLSQPELPIPDTEVFPPAPERFSMHQPGWGLAGWFLSGKDAPGDAADAEEYTWFGFARSRHEGLDLRGADLSGEDLSHLPLDFVKAGLWEVKPAQSLTWTSELLARASTNLDDCNLSDASLRAAVLVSAQMRGVRAIGCDFTDTDMRYADLSNSRCDQSVFVRANLGGVNGRRTSFRQASFARASLGGADLTESTLVQATAEGSDFIRLRGGGFWFGRGADLAGADLSDARLEGATFGDAFVHASLRGCLAYGTVFAGAELAGVDLREVDLTRCFLGGAQLTNAHLEGAALGTTSLGGGDLPPDSHVVDINAVSAGLEALERGDPELGRALLQAPAAIGRVRKWLHEFLSALGAADLRGVFFDATTRIDGEAFRLGAAGGMRIDGTHWGDTDLTQIDWAAIPRLGDEVAIGAASPIGDTESDVAVTEAAARANRQVAAVLRDQGLVEEGDRYALRAKVLQRRGYRRRRKWVRYAGSFALSILCGYGYRPARALGAYVLVVAGFAALLILATRHQAESLSLHEAIVASISSFHGRAIPPGETAMLGNLASAVSATEAVLGLLIEVTFIATFTQRFLSR